MVNGKRAIVSGANRGIGHAIVEDLAENGANIFACARKQSEEFEIWCRKIAQKNHVEVIPIYFDLNESEQIKEAFQKIKATKEPIDILVNVAGNVFNANFQMTSIEKTQELFQINLFAQMQFTQYILKIMTRQKSGSIINIASSGGIDANAGRTAYNASKAAVITMSQTLAKEVGGLGIRVNVVAPGLVDTDMARNYTPQDTMEIELNASCLKRIGTPQEIAHVVSFLGSDLSSFVTGQVWRVDGGM